MIVHGKEDKASLRDIVQAALSPYAGDHPSEVLAGALLQLSYELTVLTEYIAVPDSAVEAPLGTHITKGMGDGIADRLRALAALVETQMDIRWSADAEGGAS
jgi:hypothetical protein